MRKRKSFIWAAAALAAAVWLFLAPGSEVKNYPSSNSGVVAFGDSLVAGVGSSRPGGFVTFLSEELGLPIVNLGRSGDTTAAALARVNLVTEKKPALTLILLGGNDFLQKVPRETTVKNLENIIAAVQASGSAVILVGLDAGVLGGNEGEIFRKLSLKYRTAYVPDVLDGIYGHRNMMSDALHPNDTGYELMAGRIKPTLRKLAD